ncbi:hypothetical protein HK101_001874, partial [Irineochytrium annulatum]
MPTGNPLPKKPFDITADNLPTGAYFKANDGTEIFYHVWKPTSSSPKAVVIAVHGLGEHIMRYDHVFKRFAEAGILVKGMDYRGHGRTLKKDPKPTPGFSNFDKVFEDLLILDSIDLDHAPDLPTFIMGHSLGGLLALTFAHHFSSKLRSKNFRG